MKNHETSISTRLKHLQKKRRLIQDGSVVSWGRPQYGGDHQRVVPWLRLVGLLPRRLGVGVIKSIGFP